MGSTLTKIIVSLPKSKHRTQLYPTLRRGRTDMISITKAFCWKNGCQILDTSTKHMRHIQRKSDLPLHVALANWTRYTWKSDWKMILRSIWQSFEQFFLSQKKSYFAWQVAYRILSMKKWRLFKIPDIDLLKAYKHCNQGFLEDFNHCLFDCPKVYKVRLWIERLIPLTSTQPELHAFVPLLFAKLWSANRCGHNRESIPPKWWSALRITTLWHIWLARNAEVWQNKPEGLQGTKARVWHQMKLYH